MPPVTRLRFGLPLKNRVTVGISHTEPSEETTANVLANALTEASVGRSASNSATAMRSA